MNITFLRALSSAIFVQVCKVKFRDLTEKWLIEPSLLWHFAVLTSGGQSLDWQLLPPSPR